MINKRRLQFIWLSILLLASFALVGSVLASSPPSFNSQLSESEGIGIMAGCTFLSLECTTYNYSSCCSAGTGNLTETHCTKKEFCNGVLKITTTIFQGCGSNPCHLSFDS